MCGMCACNASCRKSLQRIVRAAEKIVGVSLPSLQDIYNTRLTRKALSIAGDPTHPTHNFFSLLPSGRRLRSLQARTNRLKDSFIHQAVRKLNSLPSLPPSPLLPHESLNSDPHSDPPLWLFLNFWLVFTKSLQRFRECTHFLKTHTNRCFDDIIDIREERENVSLSGFNMLSVRSSVPNT